MKFPCSLQFLWSVQFQQFIFHLVVCRLVDGWDPKETHKNRFNDYMIMTALIKVQSPTEILILRESISDSKKGVQGHIYSKCGLDSQQ